MAAGFDVLWSKVRLKRKTPTPLVRGRAFPDGEIEFNGEGSGAGYNLGLHYEPLSGVKLGVAYRSQIKVNHHGGLSTQPAGAVRGGAQQRRARPPLSIPRR